MKKSILVTGITLFIICTFFPFLTMAKTQIDTSFGDAGVSLQDFKFGDDEAHAIAVQNDGKILVVGYKHNGSVKNLIVSRFSENGTLDTDFGTAGVFSDSLNSGDTVGRSVMVQDDDKIVIAGTTDNGSSEVSIFVMRLTSTGNLDTSFSSNGYEYVILSEVGSDIDSTVIQLTENEASDEQDQAIIVGATITSTALDTNYAYFAKLDTEGNLDTNFGVDGYITYTNDSNDVQINSITILSDDNILAGGSFSVSGTHRAGLLQLTEAGALDTTYDSDGIVTFDLGGDSSVINSIAEASDGNIIVVGAIDNGEYDEAFMAEVTAAGSLDTDFSPSGVYTTSYSVENVLYSVSLQDDDSISAVGFITTTNGKDIFVLSQEEQSGTIAITYIANDIAENDDIAFAVALENDLLLAAGSSSNGNDLDVALLRFAVDPTLSTTTTTPTTTSSISGITTSGFRITTHPVTEITRVGAATGGTIVDTTPGTCAERCTSQCENDDDTTCYSSCTATCEDGVTITRRGIVYGTEPNPAYAPDETEEETTETTTTASDTDSDTDTDSTSSSGSIFPDSDSTGSIFPESVTYYIVRLGNTDDGEGEGQYTTEISSMTPGTKYYLRAYAVLSNGEVIYGNEYTIETDDACFIATAAYGSILEKHVVVLRQFRDSYLLTNTIGQRFVALYYHFSPPIADAIRDNATLQSIVRIALFPAVLFALFFVKTALLTKLICFAIGLPGILLLIFSALRQKTSHNKQESWRLV